MKAAIVGAAGFLGQALCNRLLAGGWEVLGYDLAAPEQMSAGLDFRAFDVLRDDLELPPATDAVYYLAQSPRYREFPTAADELFGVNTQGAIRAAQAACGAGVGFFCYTSTGSVYAPSFDPLTENHPLRRDEPYALSKVAAEEALALFAARMAVLAARLFGLFGRGQKRMLPAVLLSRIQSGEEISLERAPDETGETGGLRVSFTYVDDAARLLDELARLALSGAALPRVLNLAGPEPISIRRFSVELGRVIGREPRFVESPRPRQHDLVADLRLLNAFVQPTWTPFSAALAASFSDPHGQCEDEPRGRRGDMTNDRCR